MFSLINRTFKGVSQLPAPQKSTLKNAGKNPPFFESNPLQPGKQDIVKFSSPDKPTQSEQGSHGSIYTTKITSDITRRFMAKKPSVKEQVRWSTFERDTDAHNNVWAPRLLKDVETFQKNRDAQIEATNKKQNGESITIHSLEWEKSLIRSRHDKWISETKGKMPTHNDEMSRKAREFSQERERFLVEE